MSHRAAQLFASFALVAACDSDDLITCGMPESCGASVEGTWQSACMPRLEDLTFLDTTVGPEPVVRACTMTLVEHDIVRDQTLTFTADRYTLASQTSGTWQGRAGASCLTEFDVTCPELPSIGAFGMTECAEVDGACRCAGVFAKPRGETSGALVVGAATVTMDGMTYDMCASGSTLGLTFDDGRTITYRRL